MTLPRQHPLGLGVRGADRLDEFIAKDGLVDGLSATLLSKEASFCCAFVHGPAGSGKTHLLKGLSHSAITRGIAVLGLDARAPAPAAGLPSAKGIDKGALVVCDDVDAPVGDAGWEEGLLNLYLEAELLPARLLFSAQSHPREAMERPELASRLAGQLVVGLERLDGEALRRMLEGKVRRRGLGIKGAALDYLLNHASRDAARLEQLLATLDRLCQARMSSQLTIPMIKSALADTTEPPRDEA